MDVEYAQTEPLEHWCDRTDGHFDQSLFVACTVTSDYTAHPNWLVVDAGDKVPLICGASVLTGLSQAVSPGSAFVQVAGSPELTYRRGGDEHGALRWMMHLINLRTVQGSSKALQKCLLLSQSAVKCC